MSADRLTLYVVYRNPSDYPGKWVVREQYSIRGVHPDDPRSRAPVPLIVADTLEQARACLPPGLTNLNRFEEDAPVIYEVWI